MGMFFYIFCPKKCIYLFIYYRFPWWLVAERTRNNDNDVWGNIPGKAVFPSVLYYSKCDASFTDVYECRNTACKRIKRLSFEHKKQGNTYLKNILTGW